MLTYFTPAQRDGHTPLTLITADTLDAWKKEHSDLAKQLDHQNFSGSHGDVAILRDATHAPTHVLYNVGTPLSFYDLSALPGQLIKHLSSGFLTHNSFKVTNDLSDDDCYNVYCGWAMGCKPLEKDKLGKAQTLPKLAADMDHGYGAAESMIESVLMLRELVDRPANQLGPEELEAEIIKVAKAHDAEIKVIKDQELIEQNFPMIYTVGMASVRRPRLVEFKWGKKSNPKLTLVGKGVCFDSGGLDIKPSAGMRSMKKDMGGAAHALALAKLIMDANLPVRLTLLIAAVENSIDGNAYRPGDVYTTRKGLTVEIGNTDAEGRLILCDTLTYGLEDKPELMIDFATLTGAARVAMGQELVPVFANKKDSADGMLSASKTTDDAVWPMPLWSNYRSDLDSDVADMCSTGGKAGMITAALFLQAFATNESDWMHLDIYANRDDAKPGRPKGAMDNGLRTTFKYLQTRFG